MIAMPVSSCYAPLYFGAGDVFVKQVFVLFECVEAIWGLCIFCFVARCCRHGQSVVCLELMLGTRCLCLAWTIR